MEPAVATTATVYVPAGVPVTTAGFDMLPVPPQAAQIASAVAHKTVLRVLRGTQMSASAASPNGSSQRTPKTLDALGAVVWTLTTPLLIEQVAAGIVAHETVSCEAFEATV
jgi:hypothetical protein